MTRESTGATLVRCAEYVWDFTIPFVHTAMYRINSDTGGNVKFMDFVARTTWQPVTIPVKQNRWFQQFTAFQRTEVLTIEEFTAAGSIGLVSL